MRRKEKSLSEVFELRALSLSFGIYTFVCVSGLIALIVLFDSLIKNHDRVLSQQTCSLLTEKMTGSIENMSNSVQDFAAVISENEKESFENIYGRLKVRNQKASYVSTGIILLDGTVYATEAERAELERQGLIASALESEEMFISKPYRSVLNGQMVLTAFSGITRGGKRVGMLFHTVPFSRVMEIAETESMDASVEVWLMEIQSSNIIRLTEGQEGLVGSWSNLKIGEEITSNREYVEWMWLMREGANTGTITYTENDNTYTQVFKKIDYMDGWSIVARIPHSAFSGTVRTFRWAVVLFFAMIVVATAILLLSFRNRSMKEKRILEELSVYDSLSQVLNRRAFDYSATEYLKKTGKSSGAILFFDIDFFKSINDTYGHETGDNVIVIFATELNKIFGGCGMVSRYGGDEFVVLVRNKTVQEINAMMEKFTANLCATVIESKGEAAEDLKIQFSAGLVKFPENGSDFKILVSMADEALYKVKAEGRNGYAWWKQEPPKKD